MKRLLIMRHAKSGWQNPGLEDRDRPLNARGQEAAAKMGQHFRECGIEIDQVIHSAAKRTHQTSDLLLEAYGRAVPSEGSEELYLSTGAAMLEVIHQTPENIQTLLVVAHFPGVQEAALLLASQAEAEAKERLSRKFPTGAVAVIDLPLDEWAELSAKKGHLMAFIIPRQLGQRGREDSPGP